MSEFANLDQICTVRIALVESEPPIWREVEVPASITLWDLHDIIQVVMNWEDYHLWEFRIEKQRYGIHSDEEFGMPSPIDAAKVHLRDVLKPRKTTIRYLYDFGDDWEHKVTISRIRPGEAGVTYPRLIGGERNAPPEDCGGIYGFYEKLATRADPDAAEHDEIKQWLGDYDPDRFDEPRISLALRAIAKRRDAARARVARKKAKSAAAPQKP